ncbi:hypothetical protein TNCT_695361 [Trichonephila clavata]|uniref:Uncharacterized protein n=1 Tax=Trichonephila clavata TaxID=2740835 RepID=A0A8X6M0G3_TRICU|nr:hypothetical protein TNCT_695361 [Trichonephila clavata]
MQLCVPSVAFFFPSSKHGGVFSREHLSRAGVKIVTTPPQANAPEIAIFLIKDWPSHSNALTTKAPPAALIVGVSMREYLTPVVISHPVIIVSIYLNIETLERVRTWTAEGSVDLVRKQE